MRRLKLYGLLLGSLSVLTLNATTIDLGSASSYSVLAASVVTNTGATVISGDLGVSQGSFITGFPPGIVYGTQHAEDASAMAAQLDTVGAFHALGGFTPTMNLTGQDLGGLTLLPGVYRFDSSAQLTGALTLDLNGNPDSLFIFQIGSTLTTASNSSVGKINGADCCNVFWQVGSSATLGTNTAFLGNILTNTSITLNTGANITDGRALAINGAVTLDTNHISNTFNTIGDPVGSMDNPEPGTLLLLGAGLAGLVLLGRRTRSRARTAHT